MRAAGSAGWWLAVALAAGCQSGGGGVDSGAAPGGQTETDGGAGALPDGGVFGQEDTGAPPDDPPDAAPPAPVCETYAPWQAGTPMFVERTDAWGLSALKVEGTRLSVGDLDGDGLADVVVRRGARRADLFGVEPQRNTWVLRNTGGGFEDITEASGFLAVRGTYPVAVGRPVEVVAFADLDNDGDLDAYSGLDTREPVPVALADGTTFDVSETSEVLINDGNASFSLTSAQDPLRRERLQDVPSGAAFVDFDRDGAVDLWMSQGGLGAPLQDRLFVNDGAGVLRDGTSAAGLTTRQWSNLGEINGGQAHTTAWSAAACDLNDDGRLELLTASYGRAPNHLWLATEAGFENRGVASGYAFDDDMEWSGDQFARCYCQANRGASGCAGVPTAVVQCGQPNWDHDTGREPFRLGGNSGATVCTDFDNDGRIDLYTTEIRHWWAGEGADGGEVLVNTGDPEVRFERPGRDATGLTLVHDEVSWDEGFITAGTLDVDNDGREDLYVGATDYAGNRGHLYHNASTPGGVLFEEVATADFFEHNRSHGMAVADFDRDGDLDVIVGHSRARCDAQAPNNCYETMQVRFFENTLANRGNWFQLDLEGGAGTNRAAIGARVSVTLGERTLVQEVNGGYGHFGAQRDRVLHFGLAEACEAVVTVRWPDAALTTQTFTLPAGHRFHLVQGGEPTVVDP